MQDLNLKQLDEPEARYEPKEFTAGEDSAYGQSYQDIVAPYFYPSDLGLVGTLYKYGVAGILLYLTMHARIWVALWRANLQVKAVSGRHDALLWALLMFMTAQTFNLMLNPGLAYAQGITLGSLAFALARLHTSPDIAKQFALQYKLHIANMEEQNRPTGIVQVEKTAGC